MEDNSRIVKVHTKELQEILGCKEFTVQIEREILVSVQASTPEEAEQIAMSKNFKGQEELLLNKVVSVTEEEE